MERERGGEVEGRGGMKEARKGDKIIIRKTKGGRKIIRKGKGRV